MSVGRRPLSDGLLEDGTGVVVNERGFVKVDEYMRTAAPNVYAVGDLVAVDGVKVHPQLAHVGFAEAHPGHQDTSSARPASRSTTRRCPGASTATPRWRSSGMTEQAAKDAGIDVVVSKHQFVGNGRAIIVGETDGLVKVIAEKGADGKAGRNHRRAHGRAVGHRATRARATWP